MDKVKALFVPPKPENSESKSSETQTPETDLKTSTDTGVEPQSAGTGGGIRDASGSYGASPGTGISSYTGDEGRLGTTGTTTTTGGGATTAGGATDSGYVSKLDPGSTVSGSDDSTRRPFAKSSTEAGTGTTTAAGSSAVPLSERDASYDTAAASSGLPGSYDTSGTQPTTVMPGAYIPTPTTENPPITTNAPQIGSSNAPQVGKPDIGENFEKSGTGGILNVDAPYAENPISSDHPTFTGNRLDPNTTEGGPFHTEPSGIVHTPPGTAGSTTAGATSSTAQPGGAFPSESQVGDKSTEHHYGRDAAVGAGATGAVGAAAYEAEKHHSDQPSTAAGTTTTTTTSTTAQPSGSQVGDKSTEHHTGRDAAIGAGAAGVAGTAAYEAEKQHSTTSPIALDPGRKGSEIPYTNEHHVERELAYDQQTGGGVAGFLHKDQKPKYQDPAEPTTTAREKYYGLDGATRASVSDERSQSVDHTGRDAAIGAGAAGATGAAAYEAEKAHKDKDAAFPGTLDPKRKESLVASDSPGRRRSSATPYTNEHHVEREMKYDQQTKGGVLGFLHKDQHPKYQDPDEPATTAREKYYGLDGATRPSITAESGSHAEAAAAATEKHEKESHKGEYAAAGAGAAGAAVAGKELFDHHDPVSSTHTRGTSRHFTDKDHAAAPASTEGKSQTHHSIFHHDSAGPNKTHGDLQSEHQGHHGAEAGIAGAGAGAGIATTAAAAEYEKTHQLHGNNTYGETTPAGGHFGQGMGGSNEGVVPAGTAADGYPSTFIDEVGASKKSLKGDGLLGHNTAGGVAGDEHVRKSSDGRRSSDIGHLAPDGSDSPRKRSLVDRILHRESPNKLTKDPPS